MFPTRVLEKIKTRVLCSITSFSPKIELFVKKVEKYCRGGKATDDNMVHMHCMLDVYGYRHTHRI